MPVIEIPFTVRRNPRTDRVRPGAKQWARRVGFFGPQPTARGLTVWDEHTFDRENFVEFSGLCLPDVPAGLFELATDWMTWGFFLDDYFLTAFGRNHDYAGAKAFTSRIPAFMPTAGPVPEVVVNPIEAGLADLWRRTTPLLDRPQRQSLSATISTTVDSFLWELQNLVQDRLPDPVDYVEMRRATSYGDFVTVLARLTSAPEMPANVLSSKAVRILDETFRDVAGLGNDIVSYDREIHREGQINNLLLITRDFLGCSLQQAVDIVHDHVRQRLAEFQRVADQDVRAMVVDLQLDGKARQSVDRYVEGLRTIMAGMFHWYGITTRNNGTSLRLPRAPHRLSVAMATMTAGRHR
jgi:germacradienol/geosmin synthase